MDYEQIRQAMRRGVENAPDDKDTDRNLILLNAVRELARIRKLLEAKQ